ncbi:hypothetical protein [Anoxybacillus sp. CHMUD]|uniref:hypothetical protein n=1 Tax=Anoxybacillus sp. CHMUD TaxID=2508870 RepID=UPI001492533C|nr:hypothetical protein [Anoxybacillus sp. CHMUD]NNU90268.1 hypothetical protein [Anoxybacillus sp. CHMUD]
MIASVQISIEQPEEMLGILRLESVTCYDASGNIIGDIPDLINNDEFHSERAVIRFVAKQLNVSEDIIEVV